MKEETRGLFPNWNHRFCLETLKRADDESTSLLKRCDETMLTKVCREISVPMKKGPIKDIAKLVVNPTFNLQYVHDVGILPDVFFLNRTSLLQLLAERLGVCHINGLLNFVHNKCTSSVKIKTIKERRSIETCSICNGVL